MESARFAAVAIRDVLAGHLLVEEGPQGVFELMREVGPALGPSLDRLRDDHEKG